MTKHQTKTEDKKLIRSSGILFTCLFLSTLVNGAQHDALASALLSGLAAIILGAFWGVLAFCRWDDVSRMRGATREMTNEQSQTSPLKCSTCGCEVKNYAMCDRSETDAMWCFDCFVETPCGKGWHGEGCATNVFEDGAPAKPDAVRWRCFHCGDTFTRAQERWARDSDLMRAISAQAADHTEALKRAEEAGYAKALRDIEAGEVEWDHAARILAAAEPIVRAT